ncbi:MAG TPA: hypothetical protein VLB46_04415 [Pyrinomonadaceae bacterium]|nr:hypothetical protein [Pyrinomonadaceae bacterium]
MFANLNFLDYVIILSGIILCLKRVAEMERYHALRVIVLSVVLCFIGGLLFLFFAATFGEPYPFDCLPEHFCHTEM